MQNDFPDQKPSLTQKPLSRIDITNKPPTITKISSSIPHGITNPFNFNNLEEKSSNSNS